MRLLAGGVHDLFFRGTPERTEPGPAKQTIQADGSGRDRRERRAVEHHHAERHERHDAVENPSTKLVVSVRWIAVVA